MIRKHPILLTVLACVWVFIIIGLTGCAEVAAMRAAAAQHSADMDDQVVGTAIWALCEKAGAGAISRRFKTDSERAAYGTLCGHLPP